MPKRLAVSRSYCNSRLQAEVLLVAVDVGQDGDFFQLVQQLRRPFATSLKSSLCSVY